MNTKGIYSSIAVGLLAKKEIHLVTTMIVNKII